MQCNNLDLYHVNVYVKVLLASGGGMTLRNGMIRRGWSDFIPSKTRVFSNKTLFAPKNAKIRLFR